MNSYAYMSLCEYVNSAYVQQVMIGHLPLVEWALIHLNTIIEVASHRTIQQMLQLTTSA